MMRITRGNVIAAAVLVAFAASAGCGNRSQEMAMPAEAPLTTAQWQALSTSRIVFGHQSVGRNMLDGVRALAADAAVDLPITETRERTGGAGLAHFAVGANGDPLGKIRDFASVMEGSLDGGLEGGVGADIALMKLCYIDFSGSADPAQVAAAYCDTLDQLQRRFPDTVFAAVTTPLTTVQGGPRALVKKLLGRPLDGLAENARRETFNDVLRGRYGSSRRLFDLAALETSGGGAACLDPALTSDGGHLNDRGARLVAARFVAFLAGLRTGPKAP